MPAQKLFSPEINPHGGQEEEPPPSPPLQNGHQSHPKQYRGDASPVSDSELHRTPEEEEEELEDDENEAAGKPDEDEDEEEEEEGEDEQEENNEEDEEDEKDTDEDSEESESSSSEEEKPKFVYVELPEIRKDVQCPICLGIIKKTRTVMECLHRFCRECIDKSMRLGNNECPACRTHCASRRSLRDDSNYDALIAAIYPDIDKYEEEELAFHEEERTRNKQIQASIAQIFQRQTEALVKRKTMGKETAGPFTARSQRNNRTNPSRKRRNSRITEFLGSEDNGDENDDNGGKDSSSTDERSAEVRNRRRKRRKGIRPSQNSPSNSNLEGGSNENDIEASKENKGVSPGFVWNTEMLVWGRGGARSHTRHGNPSSSNNKNPRNTRVSKLVEYLKGLEEKNDELDVHLMLISLENQSAPNLKQPYLCCRPSLSVKHLCAYVALQTPMQAEDIEILLVKGPHKPTDDLSNLHPPISTDELQILKDQETLSTLGVNCTSNKDILILAYRPKGRTSTSTC